MDAPADPAETDADGSPHALVRLLDRLSAVPEGERTSVADLMRGLGEASLLSLLLLPALVIVSPLSGIPMLPTLCGLAIALIAAQLMIGRDDIWLPEWLLRRSMDSARLRKALSWLKRPARWIDRITAHRLDLLVQGPARPLLLTACALAGLAMPFLELLPFTSSILAGAVTLIGLGLLVRDGVMALLGLGCIAGGLALILWLLRAVT